MDIYTKIALTICDYVQLDKCMYKDIHCSTVYYKNILGIV